jgi:uncharacterized membrane protein YgdD (TMEM256/DUF423 family)
LNQSARRVAVVAAVLAFFAVIFGAMGSHLVDMKGLESSWQTASNIHLFSAAALLSLAALMAQQDSSVLRWGVWMICLGTVIFCGSIYLHVITGQRLPAVTPFGGIVMMSGWLVTALGFWRMAEN